MSEIILHPTGSAPLRIRGELLLEDSTQEEDANRWHEIEVYRLEDGRHAVLGRYQSQWQGEGEVTRVEEVGDASTLELALLDLKEEILLPESYGFPAREWQENDPMAKRQAKLLAQLGIRYDQMVSRILGKIEGTAKEL